MNGVDVQLLVHFGTLCLCSLVADHQGSDYAGGATMCVHVHFDMQAGKLNTIRAKKLVSAVETVFGCC